MKLGFQVVCLTIVSQLGCRGGALRDASPSPVAAPAPTPAQADALAAVEQLDCGSSLPEKHGETLRAFRGPGPNGSAFNWQAGELVCELRVRVGCRTSGTLRLGVGSATLPEEPFGHTTGGSISARLRVPRELWTAQLEQRPELPYRTLQLSARIDGACADADAGTARTYHAIDAFIAGFAEGE